MLPKDIFNKGIDKLLTEFSDKGFKMTKDRSTQWYEFMGNMSNAEFEKKIQNCLMTCRRAPSMADVLGFKDGDNFEPANAAAYEVI